MTGVSSPLRLTVRGWALLAAAFAGLVAAYATGWPALLAVSVFLAGLVAAGALVVRFAPVQLTVEREMTPAVTDPGLPADVLLTVRGRSAIEAEWSDDVIYGLTVSGANSGVLPAMHGRPIQLGYSIVGRRRGAHRVGPMRIDRMDPLGVVVARRPGGPAGVLTVLPNLHPVRPPSAVARVDLDPAASAVLGTAGEQRDILAREYRQGDSLRHVDWRATAHRGELMVRAEAATNATTSAVVFDVRASSWGDQDEFEWAVEAVASLLVALSTGTSTVRFVADAATAPMTELADALVALATIQPGSGGGAPAELVQSAVGGNVQALHLVTGPGARFQLAHLPVVGTGVFATVSIVGGASGGDLDPARGWRAVRLDPNRPVEEAWRGHR
jgi:uncharacterized protein (DUF58 family)